MNRLKLLVAISLTLLILSACNKPAQNSATPSPQPAKISSQSVVKAAVAPVEIKAGESIEAIVKINTQSGYHINANPPSFEYLKATELDLENTPEVSVDYIYYPNPQVKKFEFSPDPLRVYEGETQLKVMLVADKSAPPGRRTLPAKLNVQACDEKVCYPPGAIDLVIPVTIK